MPIFVEVRWMASNEISVIENCHFASCGRQIFRNFIYETKIIMSEHVVPQSLFIGIETVSTTKYVGKTTSFRHSTQSKR